jgi:hypothetical protein
MPGVPRPELTPPTQLCITKDALCLGWNSPPPAPWAVVCSDKLMHTCVFCAVHAKRCASAPQRREGG